MTGGWRTYQHGDLGTILAWHVPGDLLAGPVPGWRIMVPPSPTAAAPAGLVGRTVLVGYSAGCQGVRSALLGPVPAPHAVVTIDGTHDDPINPSQVNLAAWGRLAARARAGDSLWIATCLASHTYVERIPKGKRGRAMATVHLLERVTGEALYAPPSRPPSGLRRDGTVSGLPAACALVRAVDDGALHLRSYASADVDHAEHLAQIERVLPGLWAELAAPWLADAAPDTVRSSPSGRLAPRPLGERIADVAREYLARGVVEVPGPGTNPQIGSMLYPCRRGGSPVAGMLDATGARILGDSPADSIAWCAASRSLFVFLAGDYTAESDRAAVPHGYRCAVWEHVADARRLGTLRPADGSYLPRPGDAAVWERDGGNPLNPGEPGHIATVITGGRAFVTIGGNEADALRESGHTCGESRLVALITCAE